MAKTLIQHAYILDPASGMFGIYDILIEEDIITRIDRHIPVSQHDMQIVDAKNALTIPGFIDLQVNPGFSIETVCQRLVTSGITTPLIMPCNINQMTYLQYYGGLKGVIQASQGQYTNVATAVSIEPEDTGLHETYMELCVPSGTIEQRICEFEQLGITAVGEVVLPLEGTAHITSSLSEPFLDELLEATQRHNYPVLLHTGLGTNGVLKAIQVANGRRLHICHVGSTVAGGDLFRVLQSIAAHPNITCDTHLSPMAGTNSTKSGLLQHYYSLGEAYHVNPDTLEITPLVHLDTESPPFYYSKENLLENNIICALSDCVQAIESDDLGEGVRAKLMVSNLFSLFQLSRTETSRRKLMFELLAKMTCNPAKILQLDRRGSISEGFFADLVILNGDSQGIDTVLVNGQIAVKHGVLTGQRAGRHLSRQDIKQNK